MSNRDDEELAVLLADLERTLTDLREAIDEDVRRGVRDERSRRPPTPGEILRFTEEYTLPTVIALLEATVQSLELLRAVLRLAGPGSTDDDDIRDRLKTRRGPETDAFRDALTDLRDALTGADLPEDSTAGSILVDAQELTAEIDSRLDKASPDRGRDDERQEREPARRGITIDVEEEDDDAVDVESELASIKESMEDEEDDGSAG
ncbi:MAG: hypothetical protein ABEH58_08410 [Haloplanus sp.]